MTRRTNKGAVLLPVAAAHKADRPELPASLYEHPCIFTERAKRQLIKRLTNLRQITVAVIRWYPDSIAVFVNENTDLLSLLSQIYNDPQPQTAAIIQIIHPERHAKLHVFNSKSAGAVKRKCRISVIALLGRPISERRHAKYKAPLQSQISVKMMARPSLLQISIFSADRRPYSFTALRISSIRSVSPLINAPSDPRSCKSFYEFIPLVKSHATVCG
jgi:hypothetical protein